MRDFKGGHGELLWAGAEILEDFEGPKAAGDQVYKSEVGAKRVRRGCEEGASKHLGGRMAPWGEHYQEKDILKDRLI